MSSFDEALEAANARSKTARIGVRLRRRGDRLYLQALLPPPLDSPRTELYWQRIALGHRATIEGLRQAEIDARQLAVELDRGTFDWNNWREIPEPVVPQVTVKDWIRRFELSYWERNDRTNGQSMTTWLTDYQQTFNKLIEVAGADSELTDQIIRATVLTAKAHSRQRKRYADKLQILARFAGLSVDLSTLKGDYGPRKLAPRDLVSVEVLEKMILEIKNPAWRWAAGMSATYGIRPHELFHLDTQELQQGGIVLRVLDETKTGSRDIWPWPERWIEVFSLRTPTYPDVKVDQRNAVLGGLLAKCFQREKVGIKPYTLRHCAIVERLLAGWDLVLVADQMGTSVEMIQKYYTHWLTRKHHQRMYDELRSKQEN